VRRHQKNAPWQHCARTHCTATCTKKHGSPCMRHPRQRIITLKNPAPNQNCIDTPPYAGMFQSAQDGILVNGFRFATGIAFSEKISWQCEEQILATAKNADLVMSSAAEFPGAV